MKPRTQEPSSSDDLFRSRLENIINLRRELAHFPLTRNRLRPLLHPA